ncbi:MAG: M28 family peptidase [Bacteroidetes bacterium]|nr:M28 family peptidase [Bacteroidota bacterium]
MKKLLLPFIAIFLPAIFSAQTNFVCTTPVAEQIMLGNYNPAMYAPSVVIDQPSVISQGILANVSPDSLKSYILQLAAFKNRNTGSDTTASNFGIGAARRWAYGKFSQFSSANENRLIPSYLQFNLQICTMGQHREAFAVLPGSDTTDKHIMIIEGHMDSRCEGLCDSLCTAEGVEDNASGSALVLELARVMSKYYFHHTIVFIITIGEEQGLYGAEAFADYTQQKGILIKAVQNNDVIGGIICGQTSSPPSCPGLNDIDSVGVRLFSLGAYNSAHKQYSRYIKLEYKEMIRPSLTWGTDIRIMSPEDRTGRGGDHQPFRQHSYTAMRFTSANEHGDANVVDTAYHDRQHTTRDTLGVDTNSDLVIDSFFVDFRYLARNAVINGNAAAMAAMSPKSPDFILSTYDSNLVIHVTQQTQYQTYRVGVRTTTNDWDSVYTFSGTLIDTINVPPATMYYVSIASVDSLGIESIFSREYMTTPLGIEDYLKVMPGIELLQNHPNPFDEATYIQFNVNEIPAYKHASVKIISTDGKLVKEIPVQLQMGNNEVLYEHGYGATGIYFYSLVIDGKVIGTKEMVFAN